MWTWPDLFDVFAVESLWGTAGNWLKDKWEPWERFLTPLHGHLAKSTVRKTGTCSVDDATQNLPWRAGSTVAVIAILTRQCYAARDQGGIANADMRDNAAKVLQAILLLADRHPGALYLCLDLGGRVLEWPMKPQGDIPVQCAFEHGHLSWPEGDYIQAIPPEVADTLDIHPGASVPLCGVLTKMWALPYHWKKT